MSACHPTGTKTNFRLGRFDARYHSPAAGPAADGNIPTHFGQSQRIDVSRIDAADALPYRDAHAGRLAMAFSEFFSIGGFSLMLVGFVRAQN
jgi:hypothetical protein